MEFEDSKPSKRTDWIYFQSQLDTGNHVNSCKFSGYNLHGTHTNIPKRCRPQSKISFQPPSTTIVLRQTWSIGLFRKMGICEEPTFCQIKDHGIQDARKALITAKGSTVSGVIKGAKAFWIGPWSPRTKHHDQAVKATVEITTHLAVAGGPRKAPSSIKGILFEARLAGLERCWKQVVRMELNQSTLCILYRLNHIVHIVKYPRAKLFRHLHAKGHAI